MVAQRFATTGKPSRFLSRAEIRPAGIGPKACAMAHCELIEARDHCRDAACTGVRDRAAAEGSEARPEDDRGIDEVRILDDACTQTSCALVHECQDHAIEQIGGRSALRGGAILHGLAVTPQVEALAALAAELLRRDPLLERRDMRYLA